MCSLLDWMGFDDVGFKGPQPPRPTFAHNPDLKRTFRSRVSAITFLGRNNGDKGLVAKLPGTTSNSGLPIPSDQHGAAKTDLTKIISVK